MGIKAMIKRSGLLLLLVACSGYSNKTSICISQKDLSVSYLKVAVDLIKKAEQNFPACDKCGDTLPHKAIDCSDLLRMGHNKSGVYKISPVNRLTEDKSVDVYCDMETNGGGWTLIQRRGDFQRAKDYFFKDWKSYKEGFGDLAKDFWLGNDNIFALTTQRLYSVRFDLQDVESNKRYAHYDTFWIDDENSDYRLHIADYSGDAGDSMIRGHNNQKFTTKDKKNDNRHDQNCAILFKGAWWYNKCHESNLNGQYLNGKHESLADGINWLSWKGYHESLQSTEIKIKPKKFSLSSATTLQPTSLTTVGMSETDWVRILGRDRFDSKSVTVRPYGSQNNPYAVLQYSNTTLLRPYRMYGLSNATSWRNRFDSKSVGAWPYGRQSSSQAVLEYSNTTLLRPYRMYGRSYVVSNATSWRNGYGTKPVWTRRYMDAKT